MAIFELYSTKKRKNNGEMPDVYQYEDIPQKLRVQIVHIVKETIGMNPSYGRESNSDSVYRQIHEILCKEYGVFSLAKRSNISNFDSVYNHFLDSDNIDECLDVIELTFKFIDIYIREKQYQFSRDENTTQTAEDAVIELNQRFKDEGVGYEFTSGEIIKIDSQFIHSEIVKPALSILQGDDFFKGARSEFLAAHTHYRSQRYKEALVDCLKSFESLMKAICEKHDWEFGKNDTAKKLINVCLTKGLVPSYMQEQFSQFRALLESGVPTVSIFYQATHNDLLTFQSIFYQATHNNLLTF